MWDPYLLQSCYLMQINVSWHFWNFAWTHHIKRFLNFKTPSRSASNAFTTIKNADPWQSMWALYKCMAVQSLEHHVVVFHQFHHIYSITHILHSIRYYKRLCPVPVKFPSLYSKLHRNSQKILKEKCVGETLEMEKWILKYDIFLLQPSKILTSHSKFTFRYELISLYSVIGTSTCQKV